ncbi:MAG: RNA polymerase sigma factor [Kutzneria sp.]|nr:RNA polymerase sigma factor [Kutzneria sp.]MBV9843484.1 RNA polymerase sigma factor [Kutzneria sp.]
MPDDEHERFERLFHDHYDAVLGYAIARADHVDQAKDAAAQTFLVAWRRRHEVPASARGWLLAVTRRTLADLRRSGERQRSIGVRLATHAEADRTSSRDATAEAVVERDAVRMALSSMTDSDAELLTLVAWDRLNYIEAAKVLGCSRVSFAVRLHRARSRFEAALRSYEASAEAGDAGEEDARPLLTVPASGISWGEGIQ